MRRRLLIGLGLVVALAGVGFAIAWAMGAGPAGAIAGLVAGTRPPIIVGLLHSQTGPLAISEKSLIDSEVLAIEEINARGGVAGRPLKWEIADGRSDPVAFAEQARRLIEEKKASVLIGGWTSECRKAMLAVVEEKGSLLIFPSNFEGIERSPHIVYSGGSANQVFPPAVRWCVDALKARKFFVVGTEELWSRCVAEVAKDAIKASASEVVGESYLPMVGGDVDALVGAIRAAGPDVVLNMMVGDSNVPLYAAIRRAGLSAEKLPVVAFNIAEDELRQFPPVEVTGHYAAWDYFQSIDRPESREFVRKFKARYGDHRTVSDAMVAAHNGLMIWAQAANEAETGDPKAVLEHFDRQSLDAPEGIVTIDPESRVAWRPFFVGRIRADAQFDVVWSLSKPIHPETYVATRSKVQWHALLDELKAKWGGRWSASGPIHPGPTPPAR
jgi:urea transport system substrate-binding protein